MRFWPSSTRERLSDASAFLVHKLYAFAMDTFRRLDPQDADLDEALDVMRAAFAGMEGRIDPPSSLDTMSVEDLRDPASEVWVCGTPIVGTVILSMKGQVLYVSKLTVAHRRTGVGRALMDLAEARARELGLGWLELKSRVELLEVHAVFKQLGFKEVARLSHAGYSRPTYILFRKPVPS